MPKIRRKAPRHITARSIALEDAKGKTRIYMDAGDGNGYATICLFGEKGKSIQIATTPEGGVYISLHGAASKVIASLGMNSDEKSALVIRDQEGLLGTTLGASWDDGTHHLSLYKNGQVAWTTEKQPKRKRKKAD